MWWDIISSYKHCVNNSSSSTLFLVDKKKSEFMYVQFNIKGKNFIKARIHCEIYLSDCFMKHNLMHISLHLIWFHEIRMTYVKRKPPRTFIGKKCHIPMFATSPCCGNWLTCFPWKGYFHRRLFFFLSNSGDFEQ